MKACFYFLIVSLVIFSCEKNSDKEPAREEEYVAGDLLVGFDENARLKSAFGLVNDFHLEIRQVSGTYYVSDLRPDSIDYVVGLLKTKSYLNDDRWRIIKGGNVYNQFGTGKITVVCQMLEMDETNQVDWTITAAILKLKEKPSLKSFYLRVPEGEEIYWRNKFRNESIVRWAELNYLTDIIRGFNSSKH